MVEPRSFGSAMAAKNLVQGDFMDSIVESTVQRLISQLKADYRKQLCKALQAASQSGDRPDCPPSPTSRKVAAGEGAPTSQAPPKTRGSQLRAAAEARQRAVISTSTSSQDLQAKLPEVDHTASSSLNVPDDSDSLNAESVESLRLPSRGCPIPGLDACGVSRECNAALVASSKAPVPPLNVLQVRTIDDHDDDDEVSEEGCHGSPTKGGAKKDKSTRSIGQRLSAMFNGIELTEEEGDVLKRIRAEEEAKQKILQQKFGKKRSTYGTASTQFFEASEASPMERRAFNIISHRYFDFVMGIVIVSNAITIGLESSITVHGKRIPLALHVCEYSFLVVYAVELFLRLYALGLKHACQSNWVKFDAVLVASGTVNFLLTVTSLGGALASGIVGNVNMLKMIRLIRLARTVRVLVQFRTLWLLVQGLMYAVMPMLWTTVIMFVVVYVFAVVGMEMIVAVKEMDADYQVAAENFNTLWSSMMTLMQFMTLDSVASIYRPLVMVNPLLVFYFLTFFLLGPIALMNIVTAIMVESSLRTANDDAEAKKAWEGMKRRTMMPKLRNIFVALDADGNSEVDFQELKTAPHEIQEQIRRIVELEELEEIFRMLDFDGSGSISIDEFVDGIMRSQADKPSELIVLVKQCREILTLLKEGDGATRAPGRHSGRKFSGVMMETLIRGVTDVARRHTASAPGDDL